MKIGILTWYFAKNYGARAQAYALYMTIKRLGHECEFINYVPDSNSEIDWKSNYNCGDISYKYFYMFRCLWRCSLYQLNTKNFPHSKKIEAADIDKLGYDLIIIGSDSVLNIHHPLNRGVYWGVGINTTPFIYYAPSCEYMNPDYADFKNGEKIAIANALCLSARDSNTQQLLERFTNKEVPIVCDPIFLYEFQVKKYKIKSNYILMYTFSPWGRYREQIKKYAIDNNLKIISVGRYSVWADISYDCASVEQWISLLKNASIVLTDSFHGMAFAIKERKKIIWLSRHDKVNKCKSLLDYFGLCDVMDYQGGNVEDYLSRNSIDINKLNKIMNENIHNSLKYLTESIQLIKK